MRSIVQLKIKLVDQLKKREKLALRLVILGLSAFLALSEVPPAPSFAHTRKKLPNSDQKTNSPAQKTKHKPKKQISPFQLSKPPQEINPLIALVDTGIDYSHPFLKESIYINAKEKGTRGLWGMDFSTPSHIKQDPIDLNGHGTHIAGIIKTIFASSKFLVAKYYKEDNSGEVNLQASLKAIGYALDKGARIINYSGGGPGADKRELNLLERSLENDVLVVTASGNEGKNLDGGTDSFRYFPASYQMENVIVVMAHDENKDPMKSSNYGAHTVTIAAPGRDIYSTYLKGEMEYMSGSSQATAFVTGICALIRYRHPELSAADIKKILIRSATPHESLKGKNRAQGFIELDKVLSFAREYALKKVKKQIAIL